MFFGTGSPAYFGSTGEESGINISAYSGTLFKIPTSFEAIQVRDQGLNTYIERLKSNSSHVRYQKWNDSLETPAAVEAVKNSPNTNRCVEIGDSVATSKYVSFSDCVSSFGSADTDALNASVPRFSIKVEGYHHPIRLSQLWGRCYIYLKFSCDRRSMFPTSPVSSLPRG